jgi:hypothetical protein
MLFPMFNDAIIRVALENSLPVIDLRSVCDLFSDSGSRLSRSSLWRWMVSRLA